jgi:hypothetical protein
MIWKAFKKGIFFMLPTEHGSIRVYDGQTCVMIIPIQGPDLVDVDAAQSLASNILEAYRSASPALTDIELDLVKGGKTLSAVRAYRERTGASLYDSKKMIDKALLDKGDEQ